VSDVSVFGELSPSNGSDLIFAEEKKTLMLNREKCALG
jgi:hypothetical protein